MWSANAGAKLYYNNGLRLETTNAGATVSGNITVSGTVDGRDVASDGSKLDGIESGSTADQTKSDIDAFKAASQPVYDDYKKNAGSLGAQLLEAASKL